MTILFIEVHDRSPDRKDNRPVIVSLPHVRKIEPNKEGALIQFDDGEELWTVESFDQIKQMLGVMAR